MLVRFLFDAGSNNLGSSPKGAFMGSIWASRPSRVWFDFGAMLVRFWSDVCSILIRVWLDFYFDFG